MRCAYPDAHARAHAGVGTRAFTGGKKADQMLELTELSYVLEVMTWVL
jgi:hypothetical protein